LNISQILYIYYKGRENLQHNKNIKHNKMTKTIKLTSADQVQLLIYIDWALDAAHSTLAEAEEDNNKKAIKEENLEIKRIEKLKNKIKG
jgi:hypothetical protein